MKLTDLEPRKNIVKSCIVCSTWRSGSNLLCRSLTQTGLVGTVSQSKEYFNEAVMERYSHSDRYADFCDYLAKVLQEGTSPNGVFCVKLHLDHFKLLVKASRKIFDDLKGKSELDVIASLFPNPQYIYLRRRDTLRQAISMVVAETSGVWLADTEEKLQQARIGKFKFQPVKLYRYKTRLDNRNARWSKTFEQHDQVFYELVYEDLSQSFYEKMNDVFLFLQIDFDARDLLVPTKKTSSEINDHWYRHYTSIPESVIGAYAELRTKVRETLASSFAWWPKKKSSTL